MKQKSSLLPALETLRLKITSRWPALKGSLAQVRKPCIRAGCRACASGEKHLAYLLSFTQKRRRRCMYVPARMVPLIEQALKNGRSIEELLYRVGPALLRENRRSGVGAETPKTPNARQIIRRKN